MKIAKCPSIIIQRVDEEISKVEYGVLQKAKSLSLAIVISLIIMVLQIIERS